MSVHILPSGIVRPPWAVVIVIIILIKERLTAISSLETTSSLLTISTSLLAKSTSLPISAPHG
jgi:hypothetical protein